jgi:TPR repeat protein
LAFYRLAAEQGHGLAISRLATIYQHGELSQPVDTAQYLYWQGQKA